MDMEQEQYESSESSEELEFENEQSPSEGFEENPDSERSDDEAQSIENDEPEPLSTIMPPNFGVRPLSYQGEDLPEHITRPSCSTTKKRSIELEEEQRERRPNNNRRNRGER